MTVTPDEKAVLDALKQVECAPFTEFSRLCAERDRLREALKRIRHHAENDWHDEDQQRALNTIAGWCDAALAGEDT